MPKLRRRTSYNIYKNPEERFWKKVVKLPTGCWIWTAAKNLNGYGVFGLSRRKNILAHRWSYEKIVGTIPDGLQVDHLCRIRACVNPVHMELVTGKTNILRGIGLTAQNKRKNRCLNGHILDKLSKRGMRYCSICEQNRVRLRLSKMTPKELAIYVDKKRASDAERRKKKQNGTYIQKNFDRTIRKQLEALSANKFQIQKG